MRRAPFAVFCLIVAGAARAQAPAEQAPPTPGSPPPGAAPAPGPSANPPPPASSPPPEYYVEPAASPPAGPAPAPQPTAEPPSAAQPPAVYEPPPPGFGAVYEPPPPPVPRHVAPKRSLWLGARLGWFVPFGNVWARGARTDPYIVYAGVPWSDYASSGPMFELDAGMRLGRNYNVFALWERAQLGAGDSEEFGEQSGGDTDMYGIGLRASSDADDIGFMTEIALGYRRARATWDDGHEYQFTDAMFEGRIGLGADIRLSPLFSLSPLVTLGVGSFGDIEREYPDGTKQNAFDDYDEADGHAWFTLSIGGHVDLLGAD